MEGIQPTCGDTAAATPVTVLGTLPVKSVSREGSNAVIDSTYQAWVGATLLTEVKWVDGHTLTAVVPAGIQAGIYGLTVQSPFDTRSTKADLFKVQAGECCAPRCSGKTCGDDGCGETCGTCGSGTQCSSAGTCTPICTPNCSNRTCGSDGCRGTCGTCASGTQCSDSGTRDGTCVSVSGCSDGTRESFASLEQFPSVAGCDALWPLGSMRAAATGVACGNSLAQCTTPANACGAGWHVCATPPYGPTDVSERLTQAQCLSQPGAYAIAVGDQNCEPCASGAGNGAACCGADCVQQNGKCIYPLSTAWFGVIDGHINGCSSIESRYSGRGVLCCRD